MRLRRDLVRRRGDRRVPVRLRRGLGQADAVLPRAWRHVHGAFRRAIAEAVATLERGKEIACDAGEIIVLADTRRAELEAEERRAAHRPKKSDSAVGVSEREQKSRERRAPLLSLPDRDRDRYFAACRAQLAPAAPAAAATLAKGDAVDGARDATGFRLGLGSVALLVCPDCGRQVSDVAPMCPGCGRPGVQAAWDRRMAQGVPPATARRRSYSPWLLVPVLLVAVVVVGAAMENAAREARESAASEAKAKKDADDVLGSSKRLRELLEREPDPPGSFRDGSFVVGTDLSPGTYRTRKGGRGCYWARLAGFSGELGDVLANGNETGPAIITIGKSDKGFESKRCGLWVTNLSAITESPAAPFGDGMYIVGTDIAPGTWRSDAPQGCYWVRLRGFSGQMGDLITNANGKGIVTIAPTDKGFKSQRCGTWSKS